MLPVPHGKQRLPQAASLISPAACLLQERAAKEHDAAAVTQLRMIGFQEQITMLQEELTKLAPEAAVLTHRRDTLQSEVGPTNIAGGLTWSACLSPPVPAEAVFSARHLVTALRRCT